MFEFVIKEKLQSNKDLIKVLDNIKYRTKLGYIKIILNTNLQVVEPTEYKITSPTTLTILEYKVNEINNKPFYIKEYKNKYSLAEIKSILKKL